MNRAFPLPKVVRPLATRTLKSQSNRQRNRRLVLETLEVRTLMDASPIISEILAANSGGLTDSDGDSSDWIELYNPTSSSISLDGWHLTDSAGDINEWQIPNIELGANQFLTIFASGKNRAVPGQELHTNFKLSTAGEYLALVRPDGTIADEYEPSFPAQVSNVSYGASFLNDNLIDEGATARFLVPNNSASASVWILPNYDTSTWNNGSIPAGFGVSEPGFEITYLKANLAVNDLDVARSVVANPALRSNTVQTVAPWVNYLGTGGGANFDNDLPFPTQSIGEDVEDFVIQAKASLEIPTSGTWTFGVNSDDGFSLVLERNSVKFQSEYFSPRGTADTLATFDIPEAGTWTATLIMYERGGGASVEFFAAPGAHSSFDPASFDLIGDVSNGGLSAFHGLAVNSNLESSMLGINPSVYCRIPFDVVDPSRYDSLVLKLKYDDGFVAYLNGVEVARRNAPAAVLYNSAATKDRSSTEVSKTETISLTSQLGLLRVGNNVLSIHGLNSSVNDPSFLIDANLNGIGLKQFPRYYFSVPTPNEANSTPFQGVVDRVTADQNGGFFESPFQVTLGTQTADSTIRYTVDGSTPTDTHGLIYSGPIQVSGTTTLRAGAFRSGFVSLPIISRTYLFLSDVLTQSLDGSAPVGWPSSWGSNTVDYGLDPEVIQTEGTAKIKEALLAIPTMAITSDLENLFDPSTGIYGNAYNDGREWERAASLELLNPDGAAGFQVNAGIRIRGGYSRSPDNPKHAFRLFFRGEYGDSTLEYPLFGSEGVSSFKKLDLRTAQNYSWSFGGDPNNTMIADVFARETQRDLGQPYTRSRWYHLYINGQYWGIYQSQERAEAEFAASYFGGVASNYDVIKPEAGPYIITATDGNDLAYRRLWNASVQGYANYEDYMRVQGKNPDGSDNPNYEVLLDVDNLIDYMIITIYGGNLDAPISNFLGNNAVNNFFAVRDRTSRSGFKFFQHDAEHTLLPWGLNENRNGPYPAGQSFEHFNPQWLHQQLMVNPEYRLRFSDIVQRSFFDGGPLSVAAVQARYQNHMNLLDQAIIAESARWGDSKRPNALTRADWIIAATVVRDQYLSQRGDIVLNQWRAIGLFPEVVAPEFFLNGTLTNGGQIPANASLRFSSNEGLVYYTTDGSDPRLIGGGIAPTAQVYDPAMVQTTVIDKGAAWKYLDNGIDQGAGWSSSTFDDTGWNTGNAELGYGDDDNNDGTPDESTVVSYGPDAGNKYITTYFRKAFSMASTGEINSLLLRLKRDDGAVVYLNGVEVARSNLPGGVITSTTLASNSVGGADESSYFDYPIAPSLLVTGINTIAVEVHQSASNSSDLSFDAELIAGKQSATPISIAQSMKLSARTMNASGTWSALNSADFITATAANASNLAITELMYNPPAPTGTELAIDKEDYEFIELRNIGSAPISLLNVKFAAGITYDFTNAAITFANPGQTIVLARNLAAFRSRYGDAPLVVGTFGSSGTNLSNGGELITLVDASGNTIQSFTYDDVSPWPTAPDGAGKSLNVRWTSGAYNSASNWRASYVALGTPGFDENDFPERLSISGDTVAENSTNALIGTLESFDPNPGDSVTYSIVPSADSSFFRIVGNQLRVGSIGLDFESSSSRSISIVAKDAGGLTIELPITIHVTNVNESPTTISLSKDTVAENLASGTLIGMLEAIDPDIASTHSFTLVSGVGSADNASFRIVNNELQTNRAFNFENQNTFSIRVRAADSELLFVESSFIISIGDSNDTPSAIQVSGNTVIENAASGTMVGNISIIDEDVNESHTLVLVPIVGSSDDTKFQIVGNELRTKTRLNFEKQSQYRIQIKATDRVGDSKLVSVDIGVLDAAEQSPTSVGDSAKVPVNGSTAINVLSNDSDPDGTIDIATLRIVVQPTYGTALVLADGRIRYTPFSDAHGDDTFSYAFDDNDENASPSANVAMRVHSTFWNPRTALDVDDDGTISPLDVLALVNDINAFGTRRLPQSSIPEKPYLDVDDDLSLSPLDVLTIVNYINSRSNGSEGEFATPSLEDSIDNAMSSWMPWEEDSVTTAKRSKRS